jgi:hypothetical protein
VSSVAISDLDLYNLPAQLNLGEHQSQRGHVYQEQACFRRLSWIAVTI